MPDNLYEVAVDLLTALRALYSIAQHELPVPGHQGSCGPDAGCDGSCVDAANCGAAMAAAFKSIRRAEESLAASRTCDDQWLIRNMAMLLRRASNRLKTIKVTTVKGPQHERLEMAKQIDDFLMRHNLQGSILRKEERG